MQPIRRIFWIPLAGDPSSIIQGTRRAQSADKPHAPGRSLPEH
jgi:hypothetical protein